MYIHVQCVSVIVLCFTSAGIQVFQTVTTMFIIHSVFANIRFLFLECSLLLYDYMSQWIQECIMSSCLLVVSEIEHEQLLSVW